MKKLFLLLLAFWLSKDLLAQGETDYWYFAKYVGLNFNTQPPTALTNSSMHVREGSAVISDKNGNLLFYTDGMTIWNKNHAQMPNGTGIENCSTSSTSQAALIVPFPNNNTLYYVFTLDCVDDPPPHILYYSIVDITLDNGLGDVTIKNQVLIDSVEEYLTAVHHCDGKSIWLMVHRYPLNEFDIFLIDGNGINNPVITNIGPNHPILGGRGYSYFSPDGSRIGISHCIGPNIELYEFDNITGIVSNPIIDNVAPPTDSSVTSQWSYAVSFSPFTKCAYFEFVIWRSNLSTSGCYQYDLEQPDSLSIINSRLLINNYGAAAMSPAKDGKIYLSAGNPNGFMDVIQNPDVVGMGCNYMSNIFPPNPQNFWSTDIGITNFIQSYFCPLGSAYNHIILEKDTILPCGSTYTLHTQGDWLSRLWSTGDTSESITISQSGCYTITGIRKNGCLKVDTVCITIGFVDTTVTRNGASLVANATNAGYQWIDCTGNQPILGETNQAFTPAGNGLYAVIVTQNGCSDTSACYAVMNVGIIKEEGIRKEGIRVYPNPVYDEITFEWDKPLEQPTNIWVYNSIGQVVAQKDITENALITQLAVTTYPAGIYFYYIPAMQQSGKFVVEK